jgi:hypothetical protein
VRDFKAFMEQGGFHGIVIQSALREIDAETLARALADQDESIRDIVFRNMSTRAVAFLKDDIRRLSEAAPESIRAAQGLFADLLEKSARATSERGTDAREKAPEPPRVDLSGREAIIRTFCALVEFAGGKGLLPFEGLEAGAGNPIFRRGLLMLIDGWDPLLIRSILEKYKASLLRAQEIEYDLIIEGIDSLAARDDSTLAEEKLRALVAGL